MRTLLWDFTERCNLKCLHCYNKSNVLNKRDTIYSQENSDIIFSQFNRLHIKHIHLLGGEPLISPQLLPFIKEAKGRDIKISINTNGTLLTDYIIDELIRLQIDQLIVSIDGLDEKTNDYIRGAGVFSTAISNLTRFISKKKAAGAEIITQIATVVTANNMASIYRLPVLAKRLGVDCINVMPIAMRGNAIKNKDALLITAEEYYNVVKKLLCYSTALGMKTQIDCKSRVLNLLGKHIGISVDSNGKYDKCLAGKEIIYMSANGDIYPCGPMAMISSEYILPTNIFKDDLEQSVSAFEIQIKTVHSKNRIPDLCIGCDIFEECTHGQCLCSFGSDLCEICNKRLHE